jgi:AraC family transcriptional regulator of adaptative response/methylated-DNA-[protein]-cysteine methyltransferase
MIDPDMAHAAFDARDRCKDGQFVGAVKTTGIYCKPSCPARRPKRENVEFFADGAAARAAGYRACKRCSPDDVARDHVAVAKAVALLSGDAPPRLAALADAVGYAPTHFQRLFTKSIGVSPSQFVRALRVERAQTALREGQSVTEAIYAAGYSAPSRFYDDLKARL